MTAFGFTMISWYLKQRCQLYLNSQTTNKKSVPFSHIFSFNRKQIWWIFIWLFNIWFNISSQISCSCESTHWSGNCLHLCLLWCYRRNLYQTDFWILKANLHLYLSCVDLCDPNILINQNLSDQYIWGRIVVLFFKRLYFFILLFIFI